MPLRHGISTGVGGNEKPGALPRLAGIETGVEIEDEPASARQRPVLITAGRADDPAAERAVLPFDGVLEIGRLSGMTSNAAWSPPDDRVSRVHARVEVVGRRFVVADANSRNGTFVDGRRCGRQSVRDGAVLAVGRHAAILSFASEEALKAIDEDGADPFLGTPTFSPPLAIAHRRLRALAHTPEPLLLMSARGVSALGYAREIHRRSGRPGALVRLTRTEEALPGGLAAVAEGTLFVEEAAELSLAAQRQLREYLELRQRSRPGARARPIPDVRIVVSTSWPWPGFGALAGLAEDGLRSVSLAPLRARKADIAVISTTFLGETGHDFTFSEAAFRAVLAYDWPGNDRELEAALDHAVRTQPFESDGPVIGLRHLPEQVVDYVQHRAAADGRLGDLPVRSTPAADGRALPPAPEPLLGRIATGLRLESLVRLLAREKHLSEREAEVVLWGAGRGLSMKEIASRLQISVKSIEYIWKRVYEKLDCETQLEAGSLLVQRALGAVEPSQADGAGSGSQGGAAAAQDFPGRS